MNTPNILTLSRLIIVPFVIISLYIQTEETAFIALILLIVAWITDILDGHMSKKIALQTKFGAFFDPFVDKILVSFTFIVLGDLDIVPMWLVILMLLRDYLVQGIRSMVMAEGTILKSELSGKIKFGIQMTTLIFSTFLVALSYSFPSIKDWMFTAILSVMVFAVLQAYYALFDFLYKNRQIIKKWL